MSSKPYHLSKRSGRIILGLCTAFISEPKNLKITDRDAEVIRRSEVILREFPITLRMGLILNLILLNRLTFFFGMGLCSFANLTDEKKVLYVNKWVRSRWNIFRELMKSLRGFVMFTYFSHKDVWTYIGYDPVAHFEERKALRERLLTEKSKL